MRFRERPPDWIVAGKLLAGPRPTEPEAFSDLARQGVGLCVNLHKRPLTPDHLRTNGLRELHLPVRDFTAPSPEVIAAAITGIDAAVAAGEAVAVNCGAGLGRTGTVIAAWFVSKGWSADGAIRMVRARRPGSIETPAQEDAVRRFAASIESNSRW